MTNEQISRFTEILKDTDLATQTILLLVATRHMVEECDKLGIKIFKEVEKNE